LKKGHIYDTLAEFRFCEFSTEGQQNDFPDDIQDLVQKASFQDKQKHFFFAQKFYTQLSSTLIFDQLLKAPSASP